MSAAGGANRVGSAWEAVYDADGERWVISYRDSDDPNYGGVGDEVAEVRRGCFSPQRTEQHARLIAAAPTMFAALRAVEAAHRMPDVPSGYESPRVKALVDALAQARAAIAAAEGAGA